MIAIVKYNAGNIKSVENAVNRLGYTCMVTDNPELLQSADKVIFPGVGEASSAMHYLKERNLDKVILGLKNPVLGICLGLQLMCSYSEEAETECLGIFKNLVRKFPAKEIVPHMGWNSINGLKGKLFNSVNEGQDVYFIHSYYAELSDKTIAQCDYILPYSAALHTKNFYACQFHPEKSGSIGEIILKNFLSL